MKKYYLTMQQACLSLVAALLLTGLAGCLKTSSWRTYKVYTPIYKNISALRAELKSEAPRALSDPGKLYIMGNRIYLNEKNKGIHVIDNSNPRLPRNLAFINVPGNIDIAMKGDVLYADMYSDLTAIDISNPAAITVKKSLTNAFMSASVMFGRITNNPDSIFAIIGMNSHDTTVNTDALVYNSVGASFQSASSSSTGATGTAGSMARFAGVGDYLYAIDLFSLDIINITAATDPLLAKRVMTGTNAETLYPYKNNLFVGTPTGMLLYNLQDPVNPARLSWAEHWRNCDPVIADDKYAFVTIYSGATCGGVLNQMEVYDISNPLKPMLLKTYPLSNPHGLAKDGNLLFVCDGKDGLKVFDATDVKNIKPVKQFGGMETYDVIALNNIAYVVAKDGLHQFDYSNPKVIWQLSKLAWVK